ncbi:hypothetical protein ACE1TI_14360 [Alteribacillus sp. JSM 102045]|uniref:hypothetical protein n=1 Tax=Alteribacillus sp. JSM 102045 TaxID=1562101 RepID=UPI0035C03B13
MHVNYPGGKAEFNIKEEHLKKAKESIQRSGYTPGSETIVEDPPISDKKLDMDSLVLH